MMDNFKKIQIYLDYYVTQLDIKLSPVFVDKTPIRNKFTKNIPWNNGWGIPSKEFNNIAVYYPNINLKIYTFEEFCTKINNDYYKGIVPLNEWYWRFKTRIDKVSI